jgi:hypothetical protein
VQVPERFGEGLHQNLANNRKVTATTNAGLVLRLSRLSSQVKRGQSGLDAFFELDARQGAPETTLGRMLELAITLPEEEAVIALPVQSIYENDRIYAIRDLAAGTTSELDGSQHEYRLEAITVERVGEAQAEDGQHRILVRSPEISAGQKIITTQLPRAISGLLVEPA